MKSSSADRGSRYFTFLRRLRAGGRSNMYGAIPYLMRAFALDRESAFHIVCEWVDRQAAEQAASVQASAQPTPRRKRAPRRRAA